MVKADMSRDYYGDLELPATCSEAEIKKQFKKLALKYHPDRNPGREAEVNSKFQTIQSAHEILIDAAERSKYDVGRRRGGAGRGVFSSTSTAAPSGGTKGNPWANMGSEWAPPPKPPGFQRKPPPSAGASRYTDGFGGGKPAPPRRPPQDPASAAEARKNNFAAWESMRNTKSSQPKNPEVPKTAYAGQSRRPVPPRPGSFANFNDEPNDLRRTPSQRRTGYAPGNSGGDEPPAANTSSYFTGNNPRPVPPIPGANQAEPPPPPPNSTRPRRSVPNLYEEPRISTPYTSHSGEKTNPFDGINVGMAGGMRDGGNTFGEGNSSTGRGSHGSVSPTRKRQAHVSPDASGLGTDNSGSPPKRTSRNYTPQPSKAEAKYTPGLSLDDDDTSSDDSIIDHRSTQNRPMASARRSRAPPKADPTSGQTGKIFSEATYPRDVNGNLSDTGKDHGPSQYALSGSSRPFPKFTPMGSTLSGPDDVFFTTSDASSARRYSSSARPDESASLCKGSESDVYYCGENTILGGSLPSSGLYPIETAQLDVLKKLISGKSCESGHCAESVTRPRFRGKVKSPVKKMASRHNDLQDQEISKHHLDKHTPRQADKATFKDLSHNTYHGERASALRVSSVDNGSPAKKYEAQSYSSRYYANDESSKREQSPDLHTTKDSPLTINPIADHNRTRFSSDADGSASSGPPRHAFASSAENINTTFSPDDWHGKFQAGDYFAAASRSSGTSRSTSRAKSPGKRNPFEKAPPVATEIDPGLQNDGDIQSPTTSSGPAKFTAEEWDQTFKPQTFSPNIIPSPGGSRTRSVRRQKNGSSIKVPQGTTKAGNAAMVDDDSAEEDKPLFDKKPVSPNAMDVDEPASSRNVPLEPSREEWRAGDTSRAGAQSGGPTPPPKHDFNADDDEDFKTNFDDLKNVEPLHNPAQGLDSFQDLSSTLPFTSKAATRAPISRDFDSKKLNLPSPPKAPVIPLIADDAQRPSPSSWSSYMATFKAYMVEWDIFNQQMIEHFQSRRRQTHEIKSGWLDSMLFTDVDKYIDGLREDSIIREHWAVAAGKHENAMTEFQWIKRVYVEGLEKAVSGGD